jgi:branched-chain amino acid transport system substrate-binding protein
MDKIAKLGLVLIVGVVVTSLTLGSYGLASAQEKKVLKVGVPTVLTGMGAAWGVPMTTGMQIRANEINSEGGLPVGGERYTIELIIEDTKYDVALSRAAGEELIYKDKVKMMMCPAGDPTDGAIDPVSTKEKVILFTITANLEILKAGHPYTFGGYLQQFAVADTYWKAIAELEPEVKTVSTLTINYRFDLIQHDAHAEDMEKLGYKMVGQNIYEPGTTDFMPAVTGAKAKNPDMILIGAAGMDAASIIRTIGDLGYKGVVGSYMTGLGLERILKGLKGAEDYAERFYDVEWAWHPPTPKLREFMATYGTIQPEWQMTAIPGYVVATTLFQAVSEAGTVEDTDKIAEALRNVRVPHPFYPGNPVMTMGGEKTLGQSHQLEIPVALNQIKNGKPISIRVLEEDIP